MKLCPQCEKENPSSANHCMHCGSELTPAENLDEVNKLHKELSEIKKTNELLKTVIETKLNKEPEESMPAPPVEKPASTQLSEPIVQHIANQSDKKVNRKYIALALGLLLIAVAVFGIFYYLNVYIPAKIDREAPRYYTIAEKTNLRSSTEAGVDYNKINTLNYGSELITYTHDNMGWSEVKDSDGNKGFISSNLLLDKSDFAVLNHIFGDMESKQCINTSKCRLALLNYYKNNSLNDSWKVYCRPKDMKPNSVYYERIMDKESKFTDFAVIIKNDITGERKLILFGFNEDESVAWTSESEAPSTGYISKIKRDSYGEINVQYSISK